MNEPGRKYMGHTWIPFEPISNGRYKNGWRLVDNGILEIKDKKLKQWPVVEIWVLR